jgi:hypothetical protein
LNTYQFFSEFIKQIHQFTSKTFIRKNPNFTKYSIFPLHQILSSTSINELNPYPLSSTNNYLSAQAPSLNHLSQMPKNYEIEDKTQSLPMHKYLASLHYS